MSQATSSRLVFDDNPAVGAWVANRIEPRPEIGQFAGIGVKQNGELIAGLLYHSHDRQVGDIQLILAADNPNWATPDNIATMLAFPFVGLECQRVTALIARKNKRSRHFVEGIGFKLEGKQRRGLKTDDLMFYGLLKEEAAKWLERFDGSRQ